MLDILMLLFSDVLLAFNFSVTKVYQKNEGTSLKRGLKFNVILGVVSAVIFWILQGFKFEIGVYSVVMAVLMSSLAAAYTIVGFKIMSMEKMALYTVFLMTGGMIVPYIWGLLFLGEPFSIVRTLGLVVIAVAVFITNADNVKINKKQILMCLAVFVLNGFVSVVSKEHQINPAAISSAGFVMLQNISKAVVCGIVMLFIKENSTSPKKLDKSSVFCILGAAVFSGVSYLLQLIGAKNIDATVLYPIVTGGSIVFTALAGRVFFKEKLTKKISIGIALCFVGTCMFL